MGIFKSATEKLITKEVEYKLHEKVLRDLANDKKDLGVWGKAFVDADGDDKRTEATYVKLMVQHYKDTAKSEAELEAIWNENYQKENVKKEENDKNKEILLEKQKKIDKKNAEKQKKIDKWDAEEKRMVREGKNLTDNDKLFFLIFGGIITFLLIAFILAFSS